MNAVLRSVSIFCFIFLIPVVLSAADFTDAEAKRFVTQWIQLSEQNRNFDKIMGLYAEEVDFHKKGVVSRSVIATDKKNYFSRWPERKHTITRISVTPGARLDAKRVELEFHYTISNGKKVLQGDVINTLVLRREKGRVLITSEKGDIRKQKRTVSNDLEQKVDTIVEKHKEGDRFAAEYRDARRYHFFDADSDGAEDVVVLFTIEGFGGGNNYSFYMALFKGTDTGYEYVDSTMVGTKLGAHPDFDSVTVRSGEIILKTMLHGPEDGACCPSIKSYTRYGLRKGKIVEVGER